MKWNAYFSVMIAFVGRYFNELRRDCVLSRAGRYLRTQKAAHTIKTNRYSLKRELPNTGKWMTKKRRKPRKAACGVGSLAPPARIELTTNP